MAKAINKTEKKAAKPRARAVSVGPVPAMRPANVFMRAMRTAITPLTRPALLRFNFGLFAGVLAIVAASQLGLWWRPAFGVYVNAAAFAVLVGIALWRETFRKLAISVAIVPVAMMITLSLPQSTTFAESVVFYDALLLLTLVYRFWFAIDEPVPNTALTTRGYGVTLPLMLVVGQLLGVVGYGMLRNHYPYHLASLPLVAAAAVVFAIAEEMFFRGLVQQRASKLMHPALAAILSAGLYTLVSVDHTTVLTPAFALLMGAVLGFIYYRKQNLLLTITVNAAAKLVYIGLLATFVLR